MKIIGSCLLCLALSGCAAYGPGEDSYGRNLQANGEEVLAAARDYMDETTHVPNSIQDLVPKYLKAVPKDPAIQYDRKTSTFSFVYEQPGSTGLTVTCHALLGQLQWVCV